jgi:hypothetical protein
MKRALSAESGSLFIGGMEGCWMASVFWLLEALTAPQTLPMPWLLLGVPLAFVGWRLAQALSRSWRSAAGLAAGLVWVLLLAKFSAFPAQTLTEPAGWVDFVVGLFQGRGGPNPIQISALAAAATWIAGLRLAAMQVGFDQILSEFQFGLLILLCVFFCAAQWGRTLPAMPSVVFLFFTFFLLGMAAGRSQDAGGWLKGETRVHWIFALVFNSAMVLIVGLLLTTVVTPGALALILGVLETLWAWMVEWIARFIAFLARLIPQPEIKTYAFGGSAPISQDPSVLPDLLSIPDHIRRIAAFLVAAFWVVLFAVCLWRMASQIAGWLRRQMNDMEGARIETLPGSFRRDLLRLLRYVCRRMAGWIAWLGYALGRQPLSEAMPAEAAAVRRMYRSLLVWSAGRGCPRKRHQTPQEFLGVLCEWLPEARAQLTLITEHYAAVRYGGRRPDTDLIKTLERNWQDVRKMRKKIRNLKERGVFRARRKL